MHAAHRTTPTGPACLIPLPGGPGVSGVARFAVRLAGGLADRGHPAALLLHAPTPDVAPLELPIDPRVTIVDARDLPPIETARPELFVERYRRATEALAGDGPAWFVLGQHAGPFAVAALAAAQAPATVRAVGVAHSDNGYDTRVLAHYEPALHALVGVSSELAGDLRAMLPHRARAITEIAYGVEIPPGPSERDPIGGRPLRLLYAGRFEHRQKRVLALPALSRELDRRGIAHALTIVGDGPARAELEAACHAAPCVSLRAPASPASLAALLRAHDAFVLPSRFEGLSIALLEALAHGCVPVVAPSRSGTSQAVIPGVTGEIAHASPDDDEPAVAIALADAVDALRRRDLAEMSRRCHAHAAKHFGLERHIERWSALLRQAADEAPRPWPAQRAIAFDDPSASGSVPADAADRLGRLLKAIGDAPIAVHGAGAHTRALAADFAHARIVCVTDDDRQRHGERLLGAPIVDPACAAQHGAAHVVISTHLHEAEVWRRRAVYERQGLAVHRLYAD